MWWRDSLLNNLQDRGSIKACTTIEGIVAKLPQLPFLKYVLREARAKTRWSTWVPLLPNEIIALATHEDKRVVQNGDQLLLVLIESLQRLESRLQGETPAAIDLWNETPVKGNTFNYRPKDEDRLTDYVKRHLHRDLGGNAIVLNREVEIRRGTGNLDGQRTDLKVDAVQKSEFDNIYHIISAIVETKACWNRGLWEAMRGQLVARYLKDNQCQHGLYLVGWFLSQSWDDTDLRKKRTPKLTIAEIQARLTKQAESLSNDALTVQSLVINTGIR